MLFKVNSVLKIENQLFLWFVFEVLLQKLLIASSILFTLLENW